jgi:hypothetical protein
MALKLVLAILAGQVQNIDDTRGLITTVEKTPIVLWIIVAA